MVPAGVLFGGRLRPAQGPPLPPLGSFWPWGPRAPRRFSGRHCSLLGARFSLPPSGIGDKGTTACRFSLFCKTCLLRWFASLTSSALGSTGISGTGAAWRFEVFGRTCLVRWFASLARTCVGLCSLLVNLTDLARQLSYTIERHSWLLNVREQRQHENPLALYCGRARH